MQPFQPRIKVALSISDSAAGGVMESLFASTLRSLGDVDVVGPSEEADYLLTGVVICLPNDCQNAERYVIALQFARPYQSFTSSVLAAVAIARKPSATYRARRDSAAAYIGSMMHGYEQSLDLWAVSWGRTVYEQAAREFIRRLDAECFEKTRAAWRYAAHPDSSARVALDEFVASRHWIC
ncbi:MAG TPA: hypothetical protein VJU82_17240 [Acidobacteriaceae bacterium]|nr:hypothetical protein [Acidobacteriaceae bacterium]